MPPLRFSRFEFTSGIWDEAHCLFLTDREPFGFKALSDNRIHEVKEGDTLFSLAGFYFSPRPRACGFWWVIADFQPDNPIIDPTLPLEIGRKLFIPSLRTLDEEIFSEDRRSLH